MSSKGAVFERTCRDVLRHAGWFVVKMSDGSDCDLVALRPEAGTRRTVVVLIEAKSGKQSCRPEQWNRLVSLSWALNATPVLADKVPGVAAPRFWEMTALKSGKRGEPQPRIPFDIDAWGTA